MAGLANVTRGCTNRAQSRSHGSSDSRGAKRSRELLIIFQVALTLILLSAAALVSKSFANATSLDLGFEPRNLATAVVDLPSPEMISSKSCALFAMACSQS